MSRLGCTMIRSISLKRNFGTSIRCNTKVAVVGAAGGIGQPLSLLLKHSPYIKSLALYDVKNVDGIAMDIGHIDTNSQVYGYSGEAQLKECLDGAEIVVITAGIPRKPGMLRSDLFGVNAKIITNVVDSICKSTFNPMIAIVSNPVNSLVPVAAEVLRLNGMFDIRKLFGVTTLDLVRASTFYSQILGCDPREVHVPVVIGHSGETIVPLFSLAKPHVENMDKVAAIITMIREAGTYVVNAKKGEGSATLAMAYSAYRFVTSLLQARLGKSDIVDYAYVYSKYHDDIDFCADPLKIDFEGVMGVMDYGTINENEKGMILTAKSQLKKDIQMGYDYVKKNYTPPPNVEAKIVGRFSDIKIKDAWNLPNDYSIYKTGNIPKSKLGDAEVTTTKSSK